MPVFLSGSEVGNLPAVTNQIPALVDIHRWDKATRNKIVLENVGNSFGIPLVGFLTMNCLRVLGVIKDDVAGRLQNVVNGSPVLPIGFHAHIFPVVFRGPCSTPAQISCKDRETLTFVSCYRMGICSGDAGNNKGFIDFHPATDGITDFDHDTSPRNSI